jgi:shikimate kinase
MNIVLIGFMGAGKTAVGKLIAEKLAYQFMDTDIIIEQDVKMDISTIFKNKGEPFFREVESKVVNLVSFLDRTVIATGGGVPLRESNMLDLKKNGLIIYLKAGPETIFSRLNGDASRPLLQKSDPLAEITKLLGARRAAYERADIKIETDMITAEQAADRIIEKYNERNNRTH